MSQSNLTGLYGKLPAHGDFIYRDLPTDFINIWDQWLQGFVGSTREQLGDSWQDIYMNSPIWRFALSSGVIDNSAWVGIVLPSVDRVGRYFPFSVATCLPAQTNVTDFLCTRSNWFSHIEDAALRALTGQLALDDLVDELNESNPQMNSPYYLKNQIESPSKLLIKRSDQTQPVNTMLPYILDSCLTGSLKTYSLWSTEGSERIAPCLFASQSLPSMQGVAAMLDGRWEHWQWQEPYALK